MWGIFGIDVVGEFMNPLCLRQRATRNWHIPPDYVVDRCAADGESRSHRDFLLRPDVWTRCRRQISERITSVISKACHFTTKSGGIWKIPTLDFTAPLCSFTPYRCAVVENSAQKAKYCLIMRPDTALLCDQILLNALRNKDILKLQHNLLQPGFYNSRQGEKELRVSNSCSG